MGSTQTLRRAAVAALLLVAFLFQGTWALAGVTGGLAGTVRDSSGAPIAGVQVQAIAPSQTATVTTDAGGHFAILALAPDTYTLNLSKTGYQSTSFPGNVVFADQTQQVALTISKALKTIQHETSQAAASLVKSGVGGDLYSVNSTQAAAAAPLGGGGNLNSAYSAMASVPGVTVAPGGMGWGSNAAYIRGQNYFFTSFEFDGVPVNRAFDNYNQSTESSLGLQELQVYTGGGPVSTASSGTSGFINQVIKTGTFPGFASIQGGIGTSTFYHQAKVEAGGSTPDRTFSYYVGLSGYNQAFRFLDNNNGASYFTPGSQFTSYSPFADTYVLTGRGPGNGVLGLCPWNTASTVGAEASLPWGNPGCWIPYTGSLGVSMIADRENVINLHFGIPRNNGLRDDIQALWTDSSLNTYGYATPDDLGPGIQQYTVAATGGLYCNNAGCGNHFNAPIYRDSLNYNLPFGANIAGQSPVKYYFPSSPTDRAFDAQIPANGGAGGVDNDIAIGKLQYTHALSQAAFLRVYGYSMYSDWLENSPVSGFTNLGTLCNTSANCSPDYELNTHTVGGAIEFNDQINDQNLLNFTGNFTEATVTRWNNGTVGTDSPIGYFSGSGSNMTCYAPVPPSKSASTKAATTPCITQAYWAYDSSTKQWVQNNPAWLSSASAGPTGGGGPASAYWGSLWNGDATGSLNLVRPQFTSFGLQDQFRPNDRLLFNAQVRFDNYTYNLENTNTPANEFYANEIAKYACVNPASNTVYTNPLAPGQPPPASPIFINGDCNTGISAITGTTATGWTHPNFTANSPGSYSLQYWSPRFSATYTQNPDTVWRVSAGRYTQPPISASVQYFNSAGNNIAQWANMMTLGFYSPFHAVTGQSAAQYDLSYERHIHGTDMSFKITPFYSWIAGQQQQALIGSGYVTQIPVGYGRNEGVEFAFNKGDFSRNGFSMQLAATYTFARVQFTNGLVPNQLIALNTAISQYNKLTKAGGGARCYTEASINPSTQVPTPGAPAPGCGPHDVANPYYNLPAQGLLNLNGWYAPFSTAIAPNINGAIATYISPWVSSLIVNYRHDKFAVTPSLQFLSGTYYGSPLDNNGYDPRSCSLNSRDAGITAASPGTNPLQCDVSPYVGGPASTPRPAMGSIVAGGFSSLGYIYTPNLQTGSFPIPGQYENPDILLGNLQVTYEATPRITLQATAANLFHTCFGGTSEPWTAAFPAGNSVCSYIAQGGYLNSSLYVSNYYNGTGPTDKKANGVNVFPSQLQSYGPSTALGGQIGGGIPTPLNVYLSAQIKL